MNENAGYCPIDGACPGIPLNDPRTILDDASPLCDPCPPPSLRDVNQPLAGEYQHGAWLNCDPKNTGDIVNNMAKDPKRHVIYKYSKAIRYLVTGVMDMFSNVILLDVQGGQVRVPIVWASAERAVSFDIQRNVRQSDTLVVDRITLPMMSLYASGFSLDMTRYTYHWAETFTRNQFGKPDAFSELKPDDTIFGRSRGLPVNVSFQLNVWTQYIEDMYEIVEQVMSKFSPIAYIRTQGNQWITVVKLDSVEPNIDLEPGNTTKRVIKFTFGFTAEHYIPQPLSRYKSVQQVRYDLTQGLEEREVVDIFSRTLIDPEKEIVTNGH